MSSGFFLGSVVPTSIVCARYGAAASSDLPQAFCRVSDCDVTTGYVETLSQHLSHSVQFGIAVHLVLWGSANWSSVLAGQTLGSLAERYVAACRLTQAQASSGMFSDAVIVASSGTFNAASQLFNPSVNSLQLRSSEHPALLQRVIAPVCDGGEGRSSTTISWLRLSTLIGDCECSATFFVPPPFGGECSMEVHMFLRNIANDLLLTANGLTMFVAHVGPEAVDDLAIETLAMQRNRLCAPIPNTKAARYLISKLQSAEGAGLTGGAGTHTTSGQREDRDAQDVLLELRALEAEHVSLRAAYMELAAATKRLNQESRQAPGGNQHAEVSPHHPRLANGQREAVLASLVASVHDLHVTAQAIEEIARGQQYQRADVEPDRTLRALLAWRQEESETLLRLMQEATLPASATTAGSSQQARMNMVSPRAATTVGPSLGSDPLTAYYRNRVDELEVQLVQLADVDVESSVAEYYCTEVARLEREVVDWMTKYQLKSKMAPS